MPAVRLDTLFPHDDPLAQWIFMVTVVADDLMMFRKPMAATLKAGDQDVPQMIALHRQMIVRLYEAERLIVAIDQHKVIEAFVSPPSQFLTDLRSVYVGRDDQESTIRRLYGLLRHRTVHYPWVGSSELSEALKDVGHADAKLTMSADGDVHTTWTTLVAAQWTLGADFGHDLVQMLQERHRVLSTTIANWGMLSTVSLMVYIKQRGIDLADLIEEA